MNDEALKRVDPPLVAALALPPDLEKLSAGSLVHRDSLAAFRRAFAPI